MATSVRPSRAVADPHGAPPSFRIRTDLPYCEVEVATDPLLFNGANLRRRSRSNFYSSGRLSVGSSSRLQYVLDANAWSFLGTYPYVYYRVIASDIGQPGRRRRVEASVQDNSTEGAPAVYVIRPGTRTPPLRRRISGNLKWLKVEENRVVSSDGATVVLRGVNRSGMEYTDQGYLDPEGIKRSTSREAAGITPQEILETTSNWRANIIRLPINQEWALTRPDYISNLDKIIELAASKGAYVLLSIHRFDQRRIFGTVKDESTGLPRDNHVPPMPEENTVRLWSMLASRYRHEPAVLYDIFNEPHKPRPDDTTYAFKLPANEKGLIHMWHSWARRIEGAIHRENNRALLFISGWDWGLNLQSYPIPKEGSTVPNAIYSAHIYYHNAPGGVADFDKYFGFQRLRLSYPIFIGEWGGFASQLGWGRTLEQYMRNLHRYKDGIWQGLAGWTAWSWADQPHLVLRTRMSRTDSNGNTLTWTNYERDNNGHNIPTEFGMLVKAALQILP